jgi:hypothetical protein
MEFEEQLRGHDKEWWHIGHVGTKEDSMSIYEMLKQGIWMHTRRQWSNMVSRTHKL